MRKALDAVIGHRAGSEVVVLCAHELAANAVLHTASGEPGGVFTVHVSEFADRWQIRVDDAGGPAIAQRQAVAEDEESGRGLLLVESLATFWKWIGGGGGSPGAILVEIPFPEAQAAVGTGVVLDDRVARGGVQGDVHADAVRDVAVP